MTKEKAEMAVRVLCHVWRLDRGFGSIPERDLSFESFFSWMSHAHPNYLNFRTTKSVKLDVNLWFEREFGQTGVE